MHALYAENFQLPEKTDTEIDKMLLLLHPTFTVEGEPLTREHRIIGALVKQLGGKVQLFESELEAVQGLSVFSNKNFAEIIAQ